MTSASEFLKSVSFPSISLKTRDIPIFGPFPRCSSVICDQIPFNYKAVEAVLDPTLDQSLCNALEVVLKDTNFSDEQIDFLNHFFSPLCTRDSPNSITWKYAEVYNDVFLYLKIGVVTATVQVLEKLGYEHLVKAMVLERGADMVPEFVIKLGEAKVSIKTLDNHTLSVLAAELPQGPHEISWERDQDKPKEYINSIARDLGFHKEHWTFLSSYEQWIGFRLVCDKERPYLLYTPVTPMANSSVPFRWVLAALLCEHLSHEIVLSPPPALQHIETRRPGTPVYRGDDVNHSEGIRTRMQRARAGTNVLYLSFSPPETPEDKLIWRRVTRWAPSRQPHTCSTVMRAPLLRLRAGTKIGYGVSGTVHKAQLVDSDRALVVKYANILHENHMYMRDALRNEFAVYSILENALSSGRIRKRFWPEFHGYFENDTLCVLLLDYAGVKLSDWEGLNDEEKEELIRYIRKMHKLGINHGDIAPRNVVRSELGQLFIIDFSKSNRKHSCLRLARRRLKRKLTPEAKKRIRCGEIRDLRIELYDPVEGAILREIRDD